MRNPRRWGEADRLPASSAAFHRELIDYGVPGPDESPGDRCRIMGARPHPVERVWLLPRGSIMIIQGAAGRAKVRGSGRAWLETVIEGEGGGW